MDLITFSLSEFESSTGEKRSILASKLDQILKTTGFLLLSDHNVPEKVISDQWNAVSTFFSQSDKEKNEVAGYPG